MSDKVCLVTGGSSGIGKEIVRLFCDRGYTVYEFSRSEKTVNSKAEHIQADVTDEKGINEAVRYIIDKSGRIDILVNCAGFGISGAIEFTDIQDAKRQFDVNFFGMVNVNKAVIPYMRESRQGRIVNISSIAAIIPIPFQAYYSASKAAINSYTCALSNELKSFNVSVCAIQPGDIATSFTDSRKKSSLGNDIYGGIIDKSVEKMEKDERGGMTPEHAAELIVKIALKKNVKPLYAIGFTNKGICFLQGMLPVRFVNYIVRKLYM